MHGPRRGSTRGAAYLDAALADARLENGLREGGWSVDDAPVAEREARAVPGAHDAVALALALGQRTAAVRTGLDERVDLLAPSHQEHRHPARIGPPQLAL